MFDLITGHTRIFRWMGAAAGVIAAAYVGYAAVAWLRYGRVDPGSPEERDALLDRFIARYDVVERHHVLIEAPADLVFAAAREQELLRAAPVRALVKVREFVLRAKPDDRERPHGLLAEAQSLGWGVLAERPAREVVVGAVTKPWQANVVFRALPPAEFIAFDEPGFVKIAWTLRADPLGDRQTIFRTETRVATTDAAARARFRTYWALASPGIILIRWLSLPMLKREAERRARAGTGTARRQSA
jgi:hypothetical protein